MAGRGLRRTFTISDQAKSDLKPGDNSNNSNNADNNVFARAPVDQSLMDIIRQEQKMVASGSVTAGTIRNADTGVVNWKSFKDRMRLRRAGNAWVDPETEVPTDHNPLFGRSISSRGGQPEEGGEGEPAKMSLMDLFGQTEGGGFGSGDEEDEGEEDEAEEENESEELYQSCCVCMVRHKGVPFEPCGHTFCRLCSRELCSSPGNCPLCNGFILEILNIF